MYKNDIKDRKKFKSNRTFEFIDKIKIVTSKRKLRFKQKNFFLIFIYNIKILL